MTEQEWLECADTTPMLEFLRGKVSDRKLRLFAVACCRYKWELLDDTYSARAINLAELTADGLAKPDELTRACESAEEEMNRTWPSQGSSPFWWAVKALSDEAFDAAIIAADAIVDGGVPAGVVAESLRDIFCDFILPVTLDPAWRTPTATSLAQAIYDDRAFDRLPILADALEDAGCDNVDILNHCRQPGVHVRGCWAVDLLLDKK